MDKHKIQNKIYTIVAVILMVSILALIAVIPGILQDKTPGSLPLRAASGALIGIGIHLFLVYIFLRGTRSNRPKRRINREIHLFWALGMMFLGFITMDGGFAFLDDVLYVSIGMFLCAFCDFAAAVVFVTALFLLKPEKKK